MHKVIEISRSEFPELLSNVVEWANSFEYASVLNSNGYSDKYGKYELLIGLGTKSKYSGSSLQELAACTSLHNKWLFGHLTYDLKNQLENLKSTNEAKFKFDLITFFSPEILVKQELNSDQVSFFAEDQSNEKQIKDFLQRRKLIKEKRNNTLPALQPRMSKEEYLKTIGVLQNEIQLGNIYEINYCQEYYNEKAEIDPTEIYLRLNDKSAMPFSTFYKVQENYVLGSSPERYLAKRGNQIFSQPIKGTAKRGINSKEDHLRKINLKNDLKEQTENVMIVDLVRNDLSRTAAKASVKVEELFGVYTFPKVHQLISTISSTLKEGNTIFDVFRTTFPMGSMSGAPKISALDIADKTECFKRELYSGTIGYISPDGDADFNVVIRSLFYSNETKYLSYGVGGAITKMAQAEQEYEECLLKMKAIFELQFID